MKHSLGIDVGSSSVKVALVQALDGKELASAQFPKTEMAMISVQNSWAEQEPDMWWDAFVNGLNELREKYAEAISKVAYIGISYQMHGLVCVNKDKEVLRPSIIWCDSRAVEIGSEGLKVIGEDYCLGCLLNSPGNFTASKLKWVKENEPDIYRAIDKVMLPGDYISMKLTGKINTTITGLSEGVFWDFKNKKVSDEIVRTYGFDQSLIPSHHESFYEHGTVLSSLAEELGLSEEVRVTYKAGDQPNNALSLNVLQPGEIAATAGTSGVVYGVVDSLFVDEKQRVNSFAHVNYSKQVDRIGVLLCINGVGISNAWVKKNFGFGEYEEMNNAAAEISPGSEGVSFFPFGNGAERMLRNVDMQASIEGLNYNRHHRGHIARAVQEGIAFAFAFGMEAFKEKGIAIQRIKAGNANMFLSELFAQTLSDLMGVEIELYNTDGAVGAARGALIGSGVLSEKEAFINLQNIKTYHPAKNSTYNVLYAQWKKTLTNKIKNQ